MAETLINIGAENAVAVLGETAGGFSEPLVPAGHMGNKNNSGERTITDGAGIIGVDAVAVIAGDADGFGNHSAVGACVERIPHDNNLLMIDLF